MVLSKKSGLGNEIEDGIAKHHADDADKDTGLEHIVLFNQSGRECNGIRWRGDRQTHGA